MPSELNPNVQFRNLIHDLSETVDEAILAMLDAPHPNDNVLASLAEARGHVVRMTHAVKIVTISIVDDNHPVTAQLPQGAVPKPLPLPKVQKQPKKKNSKVERPGIAKYLRSPVAFDCPTCKAEAGTPCFEMTGPGHKSQVTEVRRTDGWMHNKRAKLAADHNTAAKAKYDREHFTNAER